MRYSCVCRYSVDQTSELLQCLGLQDVSAFQDNGVTGGDLLELSQEELQTDLGLHSLQVHNCLVGSTIPWKGYHHLVTCRDMTAE